jgi:Dyp-type peroxidase family
MKRLLKNMVNGRVRPIDASPDPSLYTDKREYEWQLKYQPILEDLQGNILNGHDRDYASHIFIRFNTDYPDQVKLRRLVMERASTSFHYVTSAKRQFEETRHYRGRGNKIRGKLFVNFFLTGAGYAYLFPGRKLEKHFRLEFLQGMIGAKKRLFDRDFTSDHDWIAEATDGKIQKEIHAMILIADDDEEYLRRSEERLIRYVLRLRKGDILTVDSKPLKEDIQLAEVLTVQRGEVIRNTDEQPIEHFGYMDGISNPLFLKSDSRRVFQFGGERFWRAWAPLDLALVPDPFGGEYAAGSFLVFRKLEQNVDLFETMKNRMATEAMGVPEDDSKFEDEKRRAGALVIGRHEDGTPMTLSDRKGYKGALPSNDFTYSARQDDTRDLPADAGFRCPFQAHIRRVNPRTDDGIKGTEDAGERAHRIVRRGITYGKRVRDEKAREGLFAELGAGLLFMCFQSNIRNQYEYLQRQANGLKDPDDNASFDPRLFDAIIGQMKDPEARLSPPQTWPLKWNVPGSNSARFAFDRCVTLKGGEYLFAPSISFLKNLAGKNARFGYIEYLLAEKGL